MGVNNAGFLWIKSNAESLLHVCARRHKNLKNNSALRHAHDIWTQRTAFFYIHISEPQ